MAIVAQKTLGEEVFPEAYYKIKKISIISDDVEIERETEQGIHIRYESVLRGEAILMVYADKIAFENRVVPIHAECLSIPIPHDVTTADLMEMAYDCVKDTLEGDYKDA